MADTAGHPDQAPPTPNPRGATSPAENDIGPSGPDAQDAATTYELARDELAAVVGRLESGGLSLDESLRLWERGEQLAALCSRFLDGARRRVDDALARAEQVE